MGSTPSIETVAENWLSVSVAFYSFPGVDHFDFCAFIAFLLLELGLLCLSYAQDLKLYQGAWRSGMELLTKSQGSRLYCCRQGLTI